MTLAAHTIYFRSIAPLTLAEAQAQKAASVQLAGNFLCKTAFNDLMFENGRLTIAQVLLNALYTNYASV